MTRSIAEKNDEKVSLKLTWINPNWLNLAYPNPSKSAQKLTFAEFNKVELNKVYLFYSS
jgi:hypothetical protein